MFSHLSFRKKWKMHIGLSFGRSPPSVSLSISVLVLCVLGPWCCFWSRILWVFYWTYAPLCLWLATFRFCSKIRLLLLLSFLHFVALCGSVRHLRTTFTFVYMQHCKLQLQHHLQALRPPLCIASAIYKFWLSPLIYRYSSTWSTLKPSFVCHQTSSLFSFRDLHLPFKSVRLWNGVNIRLSHRSK